MFTKDEMNILSEIMNKLKDNCYTDEFKVDAFGTYGDKSSDTAEFLKHVKIGTYLIKSI
jgi:hypothetical protein